MPAKLDPNTLTYRDAQILVSQLAGDTLDETAEIVGTSRDTVKRAKNKPAYREAFLAALEQKGYSIEQQAQNLIDLTKADKEINAGGRLETVPDNITRFNAVKAIGGYYGLDAPKEIDITGSFARLSDAELAVELEASIQNAGLSGEEQGLSPDDPGQK